MGGRESERGRKSEETRERGREEMGNPRVRRRRRWLSLPYTPAFLYS